MIAVIKKTGAEKPFSFSFVNDYGDTLIRSDNYTARKNASLGVASVKKNCVNYNRYELKETKSGKFYFNIKASNGQVVATSSLFSTPALRDDAISQMKIEAPLARELEIEAVE